LCVNQKINVHLGSIPLSEKKSSATFEKKTNCSVAVSSDGRRDFSYRKVHLFDVDVQGHNPVRESDAFQSGDQLVVWSLNGFKIGLSICYDIRFSELFSVYAEAQVDLILVPSAFLVPTGRAHWHTLLKARAIENQCFVAAAAQSGVHSGGRETFGHSLVVDPWGHVVLDAGSQSGPVLFNVSLERQLVSKVRKQIPMNSHRKAFFRPQTSKVKFI
jgi:predicted amidohydrolase